MEEEMNAAQALLGVNACAGWLVGLLLVVVGMLVVRKAHSTAGSLFAGAGVARFLLSCCATAPRVWLDVDIDLYLMLGPVASLLATGAHVLTGGLLLASLVLLSRHVIAKSATAEGVA